MIDVFSNLECEDGFDPWCDMLFEVVDVKRPWLSGKTTIDCIADAAGVSVGFRATIKAKDWKFVPAKDDSSIPLWWGHVTLQSRGQESDRLLRAMQDFYKLDARGVFPVDVGCQAVALEGNPTDLHAGPLRTKLFFDDGESEARYAELYFNVDLESGYAALNEKDPEYREPLIGWLSGEARAGSALQ